ncbi:hypothetical protein KC906_00430 [Candidatus Kaiserbacteria bacterium]|nr:hypothetical protein [Candidatus Kaiserbacteria bacterium]MCB9812287.1 hypothetical protein [Candidatus Nomurabacteria bacterium]
MKRTFETVAGVTILVLMLVVLGLLLTAPPALAPQQTQIDPSSLELETEPEDTTLDEVPAQSAPGELVACTMDAKMCPDGSFVGRTGPNCEFSPCPEAVEAVPSPTVHYCEPRETDAHVACIDLYEPVCGFVQVECITTPCNPVPETFSNSCYACANDRVRSYEAGECVEVN